MRPQYWYLILTALLVVAVFPLPYGYYTFLRLVVCAASAWTAFSIFRAKGIHWTSIMSGGLALLFNPAIPVFLTRELWLPIDIVSAAFFAYLALRAPRSAAKTSGG